MGTVIRPEISKNNKYWISKHRYYELKHFCLQYPDWKKEYDLLGVPTLSSSVIERLPSTNIHSDPTAEYVLRREAIKERIDLIETIIKETDKYLYDYILKGVTEGISYTYLKTVMKIPCGKDMYYDRYRKFFWLLNNSRK